MPELGTVALLLLLPLLLPLPPLYAVAAAAHRTLLPDREQRCVDGRFLGDLLRAEETESAAAPTVREVRRHVLVSFSSFTEWDVLCPGAARSLHERHTYSLQFQAVGFNLKRNVVVRVAPHTVDIVVFLLGGRGISLQLEARRHSYQVLKYFDRSIPILAAVVGGSRADVEVVLDEMYGHRWWRVSAALQKHGHQIVHNGHVDEVPVYSRRLLYQPNERCGSSVSNTSLVVTWSPQAGGGAKSALLSDGLFPPRPRTDDLNGCIVTVVPKYSPPYIYTKEHRDQQSDKLQNMVCGVDVEMLNYFAKAKNVEIKLLPIQEDAVDVMGRGEADAVVGGLFPTPARYHAYALSAMYTTDSINCYVMREHPLPRWQYPIAVLSYKAWAALVVGMACLVGTLTWLNRQGVMTNVILLWGVLLEGRSMPTWMSTRTSLLIFVWIIFSMHFTAGYRASLAMANTRPITRPGPFDLDEAVQVVQRVGIKDRFMIDYLEQDGALAELLRRVEMCDGMSNCSRLVRSEPGVAALILTSRFMKFVMPRYFLDYRGRKLLKPLHQPLYTFHVSALVPKGSPIVVALDDAVYRSQEAGLVVAWLSRLQMVYNQQVSSVWRRGHSGPKPLNLTQCIGPLFALGVGLFGATCVLAFEVLGYQGMKVAGIETDSPPDSEDDGVPRDVGVDAPLQALKAQIEAEEQQAAAEAELAESAVVAVSSVPAVRFADGTAILGEGEGRYSRATRLEAEVMTERGHEEGATVVPETDEAGHGAATLLSDGTVLLGDTLSAVTMPGAATLLPDGTMLLGAAAAAAAGLIPDREHPFGEAVQPEEAPGSASATETTEMPLGGMLMQDHGTRLRRGQTSDHVGDVHADAHCHRSAPKTPKTTAS